MQGQSKNAFVCLSGLAWLACLACLACLAAQLAWLPGLGLPGLPGLPPAPQIVITVEDCWLAVDSLCLTVACMPHNEAWRHSKQDTNKQAWSSARLRRAGHRRAKRQAARSAKCRRCRRQLVLEVAPELRRELKIQFRARLSIKPLRALFHRINNCAGISTCIFIRSGSCEGVLGS